jgi:hypothetical protein
MIREAEPFGVDDFSVGCDRQRETGRASRDPFLGLAIGVFLGFRVRCELRNSFRRLALKWAGTRKQKSPVAISDERLIGSNPLVILLTGDPVVSLSRHRKAVSPPARPTLCLPRAIRSAETSAARQCRGVARSCITSWKSFGGFRRRQERPIQHSRQRSTADLLRVA